MARQLFIFSAPSGAGKTTITQHLLRTFPALKFSVSATTRNRRPGEEHGRDYLFLTREEFQRNIAQGNLAEYEEIFGNYYGTLKSEISRALEHGELVVCDVDVKGALSLQRAFPEHSLLVFIAPPSLEELGRRLGGRKTETEEQLRTRLARARMELDCKEQFDVVLVNDVLANTLQQAEDLIRRYLPQS